MKQLILLLLTLLLSLSLISCGKESTDVMQEDTDISPESADVLPDSEDADTSSSDQGDPGDTNDPAWWGVFIGNGFFMEITEFSGDGFCFEIRDQDDNTVMDGTAEISPDDDHLAELLYGKIRFVLSENYSEIEFFTQGTEWGDLSGKYTMPDQNDPYGLEEGRGDLMTINTEEDASAYLLDKLIEIGYDTQGTALVAAPDYDDGGLFSQKGDVWFFTWGKNTAEKFTAEKHFAVTYDWEFWEYDVLNDEWLNIDHED